MAIQLGLPGVLLGLFIGFFLSLMCQTATVVQPPPMAYHQQSHHSSSGGGGGSAALEAMRKEYGYCPDAPLGPKPLPVMMSRAHIPNILQAEGGFRRGAELGVQRGLFSYHNLLVWPSAEEYVLVDLWAQQKNYQDDANVDAEVQESIMDFALRHLAKFKNKLKICRNFTTSCAENYPDGYFDFVYVDARHDFKGVAADLEAWWPKVRCGGIMAGHDYVIQRELDRITITKQNWTVNYDGTLDETGTVVKGAVDEFFQGSNSYGHKRQIQVTYRDGIFVSWVVRK